MEGKCGVLCQHPGCWYAGGKFAYIHQKPSKYLKYLSKLANRRKQHENGQFPSKDLHEKSYTVDGLPTLKIQTLNQYHHLCEDKSNKKSPLTFQSKQSKSHSSLQPEIKYVQMSLEQDQNHDDRPMDVIFRPILIWKPGYKTTLPPSSEPSEIPPPPPTPPFQGAVAGRSFLMMHTSNLTETLPPQITTPPPKVATNQLPNNLKRFVSMDAMSYFGDIPLPPQVQEILLQLRSESSGSVEYLSYLDSTPTSSRISHKPPIITHRNNGASRSHTHLPLHQQLHQFSSSRLTGGASQYNVSSFSRSLSLNPLEALRANRAHKSPERSRIFRPSKVGEDVHTHTTVIHLPRLNQSATNQTECSDDDDMFHFLHDHDVTYRIHSRSRSKPSRQQRTSSKNRNTSCSMCLPQEKVATKNNTVPTTESDMGTKPTLSTHTVTLEFGSNSDFNRLSRTTRGIKSVTPSNPLPRSNSFKGHKINRPFSEETETLSLNDGVLMDEQAESSEPEFVVPKTPEIRHLVSESPDYILVGAEGGHLILVNKEGGMVMQQLVESESEVNIHPRIDSMPLQDKNIFGVGSK